MLINTYIILKMVKYGKWVQKLDFDKSFSLPFEWVRTTQSVDVTRHRIQWMMGDPFVGFRRRRTSRTLRESSSSSSSTSRRGLLLSCTAYDSTDGTDGMYIDDDSVFARVKRLVAFSLLEKSNYNYDATTTTTPTVGRPLEYFSNIPGKFRRRGGVLTTTTTVRESRGSPPLLTRRRAERLVKLVVGCVLTYRAYAFAMENGTEEGKRRRERRRLRQCAMQRMREAETYENFEDAALALEKLEEEEEEAARGNAANGGGVVESGGGKAAAVPSQRGWRGKKKPAPPPLGSREYDVDLIEEQLRQLQAQRALGNVEEMMFLLRADILRNLGSLSGGDYRARLGSGEATHGRVPRAVRRYIAELKSQLWSIAQDETVTLQEKLVFLQETRHCFGRAALMMSGGGTLGTFHVGVARALNRKHLLPRVLAGSSVGSIIAAIIGSRTQEELDEFFSEEHFYDLLPDLTFFSGNDPMSVMKHYLRTGALHDIDFFQRCLRALLGDLTFQEAYDRSGGRILSVCVCATTTGEKPRLLNYLTSPHVVLWSAVAASCAFPSLFPPQPLLAKSRNGAFVPWLPDGKDGPRRWRDGSLEADLPMDNLRELFNCNYFIVSQTNPHIVPLLRIKRWFTSRGRLFTLWAYFIESEWKHRCRQILDIAPRFDVFDIFKLFGQQWEGDATAVMWYNWKQFSHIASNPTREFLFETATMAEKEIWPQLSTIEHACGIELVLDECVASLRKHLRHHGRMGSRGRVPSWNMVNFASRGSYAEMQRNASIATASDSGAAGASSDRLAGGSRRRVSKSSSVASLIYSEDAENDDSIAPTDIIAAAESASERDIERALYANDVDVDDSISGDTL